MAAVAGAQPPQREAPSRADARKSEADKDQKVHGRIVRTQGSDRVIIRTPENKEVTLYTNSDTRYLRGGKAVEVAPGPPPWTQQIASMASSVPPCRTARRLASLT